MGGKSENGLNEPPSCVQIAVYVGVCTARGRRRQLFDFGTHLSMIGANQH